MKKLLLIAAIGFSAISATAQDKNVASAKESLTLDGDTLKAKEYIEKAIQDPSTKNEAKTWWVRAGIYLAMQSSGKYKSSAPYKEATASLIKVIEIKPDYQKNEVNANLLSCAYIYFNDGIENYNARKFDDAIDLMKHVVEIHDLQGGKRFSDKSFDTIAAKAKYVIANAAYYGNRYDEAITYINELKTSPYIKEPVLYMNLSDIYEKQKKDAESIAALEEGRKAFPDDKSLRIAEINYYIKTGQQDVLIKKLEDAVAKEPNNGELQAILGNGYEQLAFPKDAAGHDLAKPASYNDYITKAENAYQKAIDATPENTANNQKAIYNYNLGALYFNEATVYNGQMKDLTTAEQKKYDDLKAKRDALFTKSIPYLENTYSAFDAKAGALSNDDKNTYISSMIALQNIYAIQGKLDKAGEMKKKIAAARAH